MRRTLQPTLQPLAALCEAVSVHEGAALRLLLVLDRWR